MNFVHWWQKVLKIGVLEVKDNQVLRIWKNLVGTTSYQMLLRRKFKKPISSSNCFNSIWFLLECKIFRVNFLYRWVNQCSAEGNVYHDNNRRTSAFPYAGQNYASKFYSTNLGKKFLAGMIQDLYDEVKTIIIIISLWILIALSMENVIDTIIECVFIGKRFFIRWYRTIQIDTKCNGWCRSLYANSLGRHIQSWLWIYHVQNGYLV